MMQTVAWLASALVFTTFYMRDQIRMRQMAVLANIAFICYALLGLDAGIFDKVLPILVLHCSSLCLNLKRLQEAMAVKGSDTQHSIRNIGLVLLASLMSVTSQAQEAIIPQAEHLAKSVGGNLPSEITPPQSIAD